MFLDPMFLYLLIIYVRSAIQAISNSFRGGDKN